MGVQASPWSVSPSFSTLIQNFLWPMTIFGIIALVVVQHRQMNLSLVIESDPYVTTEEAIIF